MSAMSSLHSTILLPDTTLLPAAEMRLLELLFLLAMAPVQGYCGGWTENRYKLTVVDNF